MKKSLKKYLTLLFFCFIAIFSVFAINALDNAGKIELSKNATKVYEEFDKDNLEYGRYAKVDLNIRANPYNESITNYDKLDVVLVLDRSGSMDNDNKMANLKIAANDLVDSLLAEDNLNRVGVVGFGSDADRNLQNLTTNKASVTNYINRMMPNGGTNLQSAIAKANTILKNGKRSDAKQIVIILTDGEPTFFNYDGERYGTGSSDTVVNYGCLDEGFFGCRKWTGSMRPSDAAKNELDKLKSDNSTSDVYTISFGDAASNANTLNKINPENEVPLYKNYTALTGDELKEKFKEIIEKSVGRIGSDSVVTDVIPKEFELTSSSKEELIAKGVKVTENSDGSTKLVWNVGNIDADIDYNLSYVVKAKDEYHGSIYTNDMASLKTVVGDNNPYYDNTNLVLDFEKPAVEIPAIANDDHYSNNSTYVGYSEDVISGTSVLTNDFNKNKKSDIHSGNTNVSVTDTIKIVTNNDVKKNSDGSYNIYKEGILQGVLVMNSDGTFEFDSEEGITGEVSFDYVIESKIKQNNETEYVFSNNATVTLNILERIKTSINGVKTWDDGNDQDGIRPDYITVNLYANGSFVKSLKVTSDNNWEYTFDDLYKYEVGHDNDSNYEIDYSIKEDAVSGYTTSYDDYNITNKHTPLKTKIAIEKKWNDNNNQDGVRPDYVNVTITGKVSDEVVYTDVIKVTKDNNWKYENNSLPKYNNGNEITYTISEDDILDNEGNVLYKAGNIAVNDNSFVLTNTHDIATTMVNGKKVWADSNDKDGVRPSTIKIVLLADGNEVDSKVIDSSNVGDNNNEWIYSFTDLDKYKDGKEIKYTVKEVMDSNTSKYYTSSKDDSNSYIIINTHNPKDVTISGTKTWVNKDNKYDSPSEITVNLEGRVGSDVVVSKSTTVSSSTNWKYSFDNLPEMKNGKIINYTVKEDGVLDYDTSYDGYDIINTYNPETINISGTKTWDDNDNQDGLRPDDITIVLYDHLENEIAKTTTNKDKDWKYSFDNLPKYANGKEIKYTVKEISVEGYETTINDFDIINKHTPETVSYKVTKLWNDNSNQDGIRPDYITVKLFKNDVLYKTQKISSSNNWTYVFKDLPKYENGNLVTYKIEEDEVKGYTTSVSPIKEGSRETKEFDSTITNTHEVEKRDIKITKTWNDNNNKNRPNSIIVKLLKDGKLFKEIILTKDMNWLYIVSGLDKYQNGNLINYTISEVGVFGYDTSYDGYNIINTLKEDTEKKDENKKVVSVTNTEINPPKTGVYEDNNSFVKEIIIGLLGISSVVVPVRLVKEF